MYPITHFLKKDLYNIKSFGKILIKAWSYRGSAVSLSLMNENLRAETQVIWFSQFCANAFVWVTGTTFDVVSKQ